MDKREIRIRLKELLFQLLLHLMVFSFYIVESRHGNVNFDIQPYRFVYFFVYFLLNMTISYVLFPKYLYQGNYWAFSAFLLGLICFVIFFEQFILDPLFFPCCSSLNALAFFLCLLEIIPLLSILSGFKFAYDLIYKQKEINELKTLVKESELNQLKSQINPHFLFNHLNNLFSYSLLNSEKVPNLILGLSNVLRHMLYSANKGNYTLKHEILHLQDLVSLYELQIEDRGTVHFHCSVQNETLLIAPLLLSVFVENAFKHSQKGQSKGIDIFINLEDIEDNVIKFTCVNNFNHQTSKLENTGGIGIENVKRRLHLLYPKKHQLLFTKKNRIFKVELILQL